MEELLKLVVGSPGAALAAGAFAFAVIGSAAYLWLRSISERLKDTPTKADIAGLLKAVEGGPDDWALPEMRRQLKAAWVEVERLKVKVETLALVDAATAGELKSLETRIAEHAKRTIENGQKGYQALFDETLSRMESILTQGKRE